MTWKITASYDGLVSDADATAYLAAIQAADGQLLEPAVRIAVNNFIVGCKADGIWNAIKASCILAGARTLSGALVPLVGAAPTNFNFVSGDYNRKTGLVGDGSTKYLDTNRLQGADPQNNCHLSVYISTADTSAGTAEYISGNAHDIYRDPPNNDFRMRSRGSQQSRANKDLDGFAGTSRSQASEFVARASGSTQPTSGASSAPTAVNVAVFRRLVSTPLYSNARLAFYSIGESLDLALLDARVTTLINAFAAAIP